ncbi:hypothetical protein N7508_005146 [Penicillium antarcticum]|uniref:uncharacterized protein n=1 Tax=Penicillium antarcticum TaxID=416450 RepID=UPI00239DD4C3|nr:uncharacterized protein N7508_005146 [Penicillium antarcticum]KAJ5306131.1 hypothetical protein N7508_005146 [Penicillium antarcticum]
MTHVLMRLLKLISNAQTSFNRSTIADAFNASISDYLESIKNNATTNGMSDSQIILKDVENAMVSYIDDMLVAYASAQLKVAEFTTSVPTLVHVVRIGSRGNITAGANITVLIILLMIAEAIHIRG